MQIQSCAKFSWHYRQHAMNKCLSVQNVEQVKEFANDSLNKIGAIKHAEHSTCYH